MTDPLMTPPEVSEYLRVPVATLYQWRMHRQGPRAGRVGKHLRYRRADVEAFAQAAFTDDPTPAA